ncbi:MAG: SDR family NAD(P)-dependent oxidoreductase [Chloroflexota bacterium]|nr:SDR family NAD(P)-dependent oxidoreductase [Chloroflexota bacterium]MDE2894502.1 SDR family NAD(P)-dependent oxidoreductase [Chloroflexota bacterium]
MREFAGKTAVVTGGASGIGLAMVERFASEGMNVVLADIQEDALRAQVQRLEQEERSVMGVVVDTMQRESLERVRDETIERFGNIHILCNNAGVFSFQDAMGLSGAGINIWDVEDSVWEWVIGVNFWGVLYGVQTFLPHMIGHGEDGHVVNTSSVAGITPGGSAYSVSKHGVLTLTEGLHQNLERIGSRIGASVLCPGTVQTQIMNADRNRPDEFGGAGERSEDEAAGVDAFLAGGMDPANVAELVLQSIVEQRCYILPHPAWDDYVRQRVENIVARTVPATLGPGEMLRRREAGEQW